MHHSLHDMFYLGLPVAEKIARPIVVYLFLVFALRLAGKRELAQLNPFDLVVLLTLANTVQNAIIGDDNSVTGGVIGATALLLINFLVVRFLYGQKKLDQWIEGKSDNIILNGRIQWKRMKEELITLPQLEAAAHKQGFTSLDEIQEATLEPGGTLTFIRKEPLPEEKRHEDLVRRLDQMSKELLEIKRQFSPKHL